MPNSIAYLMLAVWPFVMLGLFRTLPPGRALIWSLLGGYLLLPPHPAEFDLPLMPPMNKYTLPNVMALVMFFATQRQKIVLWPKSTVARICTALFLFTPVFTVLTNPEPVLFAAGGLRGLYTLDIFALVITQGIFLISYTLARQLLKTREDMRDLLLAMVIAGVFYAFPMLIEVRLSPQLNLWIYGYFQHLFEQMIRGGGFRPIVFLSHGIWAAMFMMMTLSAAVILLRNNPGKIRPWLFCAAIFMAGVLVLSKTLSPFIYALFLVAAMLLTGWRTQVKIAVVIAALALIYPAAKGADLVPEARILAAAETVSAERANSLRFRFDNETMLLERAREKPLFGWGSWGRNHIHDPITGEIRSVTDGRWILTMGMFGWFGFLGEFGLLVLPIFLIALEASAARKRPNRGKPTARHVMARRQAEFPARDEQEFVSPLVGGMTLLLALNIVDLLPNATLTPMTWLLAGCLMGYAERLAEKRKSLAQPAATEPQADPVTQKPRTVL
jgi:hypothetical protein